MLSLDKITEADANNLRCILRELEDDHAFTWTADLRQGGFSLHVKVEGKPGVHAMSHMCNTMLKSPDILHHLLVKLLHNELADELEAVQQ